MPGLIHSWYIIAHYPEDSEIYEYDYESQSYYGNDHHHHHYHHHHHDRSGGSGGGFSATSTSNARVSNAYVPLPQNPPQQVIVTLPAPTNVPVTVASPGPDTQHPQPQEFSPLRPVSSPFQPQPGPSTPSSSSQIPVATPSSDINKSSSGPGAIPESLPPSYDEVIRDTVNSTS